MITVLREKLRLAPPGGQPPSISLRDNPTAHSVEGVGLDLDLAEDLWTLAPDLSDVEVEAGIHSSASENNAA